MPKKPDERFAITCAPTESADVLDLLGGFARRRPLSGEELLRQAEEPHTSFLLPELKGH